MQEFEIDSENVREAKYYLSASDKRNKKDYQGAINDCNSIISISKNNQFQFYDAALEIRASCKEALGDLYGAIQDYDLLVKFKPNEGRYLVSRAEFKIRLKDLDGAKSDYHYALNLMSDTSDKLSVINHLLNLELQQGNMQEFANLMEKFSYLMGGETNSAEVAIKQNIVSSEIKEEQTDDFQSKLKALEDDVINSNLNLSELNKRFQELEQEAVQSKSIDFYLLRARFYDVSAQHDKSKVRQETLYRKALQDYRQAIDFDPFVEEAPERIEEIESILELISSKTVVKPTFFSNLSSVKQNVAPMLAKKSNSSSREIKRVENSEENFQPLNISKK